jgi:SHS2 domain-containing protein
MQKYRILPHTADAKFQAFGASLEEAFTNAALATTSLMWDWREAKNTQSFPVSVQGTDLEQLLYRFLEEIPFFLNTKKFLLGSIKDLRIEKIDGVYRLEAVFWGDEFQDHYEVFGDVKAITYSEMKIEQCCDRWTIQVVVDM